ncbi:uncharacterized protein LOC132937598 [Metopolophium dirhodum]|uniref:uncharacterized protein LOC132937598 n=1 Tax=Metopolophium dirhodum TaxID=44670 RepID=UPI00298F81B7|nr:uncharacterized protein LOC132937598 [Metopolophium dirhodum]
MNMRSACLRRDVRVGILRVERSKRQETILYSFQTQLITGQIRKPNYRSILEDGTDKVEVEGTETGGGGKEGCVSFDESEDLQALSTVAGSCNASKPTVCQPIRKNVMVELNLMHNKACMLCGHKEISEKLYGLLYQLDDVVIHHYCILLSSRSLQNGADNEGIYGFLLKDIRAELSRASKQNCFYCKKKGASILCCRGKCQKLDPSWETVPNAFAELSERQQKCSIETCLCPYNEEYQLPSGPWEILLCNSCGSNGTHRLCSYLEQEWCCSVCKGVSDKDAAKKKIKLESLDNCSGSLSMSEGQVSTHNGEVSQRRHSIIDDSILILDSNDSNDSNSSVQCISDDEQQVEQMPQIQLPIISSYGSIQEGFMSDFFNRHGYPAFANHSMNKYSN